MGLEVDPGCCAAGQAFAGWRLVAWSSRWAGLPAVLERHPGLAGLLKTRDPLSPHSLALAKAFLVSLQAAGLPGRETAVAFTTRRELHAFLRFLLADRFPALTTLGERAWADDRDDSFAVGLGTIITGLQAL